MTIGELIYCRRKELNLTLEEVGLAVGVSKSTVKKWENGFIANMRRDRIEKLANVLRISPIALLGIDDDFIETHEFLKTITDPEHTSVQVKEQEAYINELIAQIKKSTPTDDGRGQKIKRMFENIVLLDDEGLDALDIIISNLVAVLKAKGKGEK